MASGLWLAFWPSVLAVIVVAGIGTKDRVPGSRWRLAFVVAAVAGVMCLAIAMWEATDPIQNLLVRDIAARAIFGAAAPLVAASAVRLVSGGPAWLRGGVGLVSGLAVLGISTVVLLLVHCTSGDCL